MPPDRPSTSERETIIPSLDPIRAAVLTFVVLLFPLGYLKGCSDEKERFDDWKKLQAALGAQQERNTARIIKEGKDAKTKADAENAAAHAALERLRRERPRTVFLPAPAPGARNPTGACFGRAELEQALQRLDAGIQGLVDEGDAAIIDLNTARRWAQSP